MDGTNLFKNAAFAATAAPTFTSPLSVFSLGGAAAKAWHQYNSLITCISWLHFQHWFPNVDTFAYIPALQ
jgi:hypothetical protein